MEELDVDVEVQDICAERFRELCETIRVIQIPLVIKFQKDKFSCVTGETSEVHVSLALCSVIIQPLTVWIFTLREQICVNVYVCDQINLMTF